MNKIVNASLTWISCSKNGKSNYLAKLTKERANMNDEYVMIKVFTQWVLEPTKFKSIYVDKLLDWIQHNATQIAPFSP